MKDEINKIIQSISDFYKLDNALKYYLDRHKAQILLDYITNLQEEKDSIDDYARHLHNENKALQEENDRLKKENIKLYKKDTKIINELKEELKITQEKWDKDKQFSKCRTMEMLDYKSRNEKAKSLTNRTIEIIKQQPSGNDEWILERLNGINYCLGSDE